MSEGKDRSGWGSFIIAALTALVTAAISWGVNGQKIARLQEDVTDLKLEQKDVERWRREQARDQARESVKLELMAEDIRVIRTDVKALDAKMEPRKRVRSQ